MDLTLKPSPLALPSGWTEPVLVCSPKGREAVPGLIRPQDGVRLFGGVWLQLEGQPFRVWPALQDEAILIFSRHPDVLIAARVNEVRSQEHPWSLGLSILGQVPA